MNNFMLGKKKVKKFENVINFKYENTECLKSGDIFLVFFMLPRIIVEKKRNILINDYSLKWNFFRAERQDRCLFYSKYKSQRLLKFRKIDQVWKLGSFFGFLSYFKNFKDILDMSVDKEVKRFNVGAKSLAFRNRLKVSTLFIKIKKILVKFTFFANASNILAMFKLKSSGKCFRKKALSFIIYKFKKKFKRLHPIRRMHRKKKKNR